MVATAVFPPAHVKASSASAFLADLVLARADVVGEAKGLLVDVRHCSFGHLHTSLLCPLGFLAFALVFAFPFARLSIVGPLVRVRSTGRWQVAQKLDDIVVSGQGIDLQIKRLGPARSSLKVSQKVVGRQCEQLAIRSNDLSQRNVVVPRRRRSL